ncbi:MAG: hypothetical protein AAF560_28110 [Acidobacteriota bacterium]
MRGVRPIRRLSLILALLFLVSASAGAQPPAEDCTGADLTSSDTLPFFDSIIPTTDDFDMTGTGCVEEGVDSAVCFTPTNGCTVTVTCEGDSGVQTANVFTGSCTTSPTSCTNTASGAIATISGLVLSAGVNVCLICEYSSPTFNDVTITATSGDCGALPVDLQSFSIEASEPSEATHADRPAFSADR